MSLVNDPLLEEVRRRVCALAQVRKLVVFGSRAHGNPQPDSDLDLMIVADVTGSAAERCRFIGSTLIDLAIPMDLVIYTGEEYEQYRTWKSSVAAIADREGIVLYG